MGRGAFGAQTVISAQLSMDVTLSSAGQNSTTSDNEQAADPAATVIFRLCAIHLESMLYK